MLLIAHTFSLFPVFAIDNIGNQDFFENPMPLNNESKINENEENFNEKSSEESTTINVIDHDQNTKEIADNKDAKNVVEQELENGDESNRETTDGFKLNMSKENNNDKNIEKATKMNVDLNGDTSLARLNFISGITLTEEFSKDKYNYKAIISSNRNAVQWGASFSGNETTAVNNNKATMDVYWNGEIVKEDITMLYGFSIPYINDRENILKIVVKAENGDTATYTISFTRIKYSDTSLIRLNFVGGIKLAEEFSKDQYEYEAYVPSNRSSISWGASFDSSTTTAVNNNKATMDVYWNGNLIKENITMLEKSTSIPYINDEENILKIIVKAENGDTATYTISFCREKYSDTSLTRLNFVGGIKLTEEFSKDQYEYEAYVPSNRSSISWGASFDSSTTTAVNSNKATMDVYWNGNLIKENITMLEKSTSIPYINDEENILKIIVKAENGDTATYTISFCREKYSDTSLARLNFISGITLTEEFSKDKYNYEAIISSNRSAVQWGASFSGNETTAVNNNKATMDVYWNGDLIKEDITMLYSFSIPYINDEENILTIIVEAENGDTATYTISFTRIKYSDTSLTRLNFANKINLTEEFSKNKYEYQAIVPNNTNTIKWGASFDSSTTTAVNNNKATMDVYWNGELVKEDITMLSSNLSLELLKKTTNIMNIVVKAENGDIANYIIQFEREFDSNTNIKEFSIKSASLDLDENIYTANMNSWQDISLDKLILEDSWAEYRAILNNKNEIYLNDKFDLDIGDNKLDIMVTSNDGTKMMYPVIFERNDNIKPNVNIVGDNMNWTNASVCINIVASDDSGIRYIELPDGEKVYYDEAEFYAEKNGVYTFKVYDNFLNETIETIEIKNIDKELPKLDIKASTTELTNSTVDIIITSSDNIGIKCIETPDGSLVDKENLIYTAEEDGNYTFKVIDLAGNEVVKSITLNNIDSVNPIIATELSNENWINDELILNVFAMSDKGIKYIELPDGSKVEDNIAEYNITENGVYMISTESLGGNITTEKVVVSNIDTELPTLNLIPSTETWTNKNVNITINGNDNAGVAYIILPNGKTVYESSYSYSVVSNGTYDFTIVDLAGNSYSKSIEINNIDKTKPIIDNRDELTKVVLDNIILDISNITSVSGINKIILPNGEEVLNPIKNIVNYKVSKNGIYKFTIIDNAGNSLDIDIPVDSLKEDIKNDNADTSNENKNNVIGENSSNNNNSNFNNTVSEASNIPETGGFNNILVLCFMISSIFGITLISKKKSV